MANTTRIKDLTAVTSIADTDVLPVDGANGTRGVTFGNLSAATLGKLASKTFSLDQGTKTIPDAVNELYKSTARNNAGGHNSIFRGKNLGTAFTSAMSKAIQAGTFDDLYVGDYLTINGTVYRIAGFNLGKQIGDNTSMGNSMCLVPDSALYNAQMHNTDSGQYTEGAANNTTTGAYANSDMRTANLAQATQKIVNDFGSSHVMPYRDILPNATSNGQASGWAWYDCKVELMSETMVYGTKVWANSGNEVGCINSQFPLFALAPEYIHRRFTYWLRGVRSATNFCNVNNNGNANNNNASNSNGVRPISSTCLIMLYADTRNEERRNCPCVGIR